MSEASASHGPEGWQRNPVSATTSTCSEFSETTASASSAGLGVGVTQNLHFKCGEDAKGASRLQPCAVAAAGASEEGRRRNRMGSWASAPLRAAARRPQAICACYFDADPWVRSPSAPQEQHMPRQSKLAARLFRTVTRSGNTNCVSTGVNQLRVTVISHQK